MFDSTLEGLQVIADKPKMRRGTEGVTIELNSSASASLNTKFFCGTTGLYKNFVKGEALASTLQPQTADQPVEIRTQQNISKNPEKKSPTCKRKREYYVNEVYKNPHSHLPESLAADPPSLARKCINLNNRCPRSRRIRKQRITDKS